MEIGVGSPEIELPTLPKVGADGYNPFEDPTSVWYGVSPDFRPRGSRPIPALKCTHISKNTGERCGNWSVRGTGYNGTKAVCRKHGGTLPNVRAHADAIVEAARLALADSVPDAINKIVHLAASDEAPHQVQLNAAKDILDRAGLKPGEKVEVDVNVGQEKPSDKIRSKLKGMGKRELESAEIDDAEEVLDSEDEV